jgi:hypothetical protein
VDPHLVADPLQEAASAALAVALQEAQVPVENGNGLHKFIDYENKT